MKQRALFIDRDGTLTYPFHYPSRPEQVRLYEDIGPGLRAIQRMGFRIIVITNQAGIARGYFTHSDLITLHHHLAQELAKQDVLIDAIYHCPHHPEGRVSEFAFSCGCRKPQPGMLLRAAADLEIDLGRSWFVGDILDDVEAGNRAGCHTILVDLGTEQAPAQPLRQPAFVARNTQHALQIISMVEDSACPVDLLYRPAMWLVPSVSSTVEGQSGPHAWYPESRVRPNTVEEREQVAQREDRYAERS